MGFLRHLRGSRNGYLVRAVIASGVILLVVTLTIAAPVITPFAPDAIDPRAAFSSSSRTHVFGTDHLGRDTLSRLLYGGRISLLVGVTSMCMSVGLGVLVGVTTGFYGGMLDSALMRLADAIMALPRLFLLLVVLAVFGGALWTVIIVIGLTSWTDSARVVRGEVLRLKESVLVESAFAVGARNWRVMALHIGPQLMGPITVVATFDIARAILIESAMSFLGLGVQPPHPTWGNMLTNAQSFMWNSPWQAVYPGVAILITVLALSYIGEAVRVFLDPRSASAA